MLTARLDPEEMNAIISRRTGLRQTDDAYLINGSALFVTQPRFVPDPAVLQRGVNTEAAKECLGGKNGVAEANDYRNIPAIVIYRWLPETKLCLVVKIDQTEAYTPAHAFGWTVAAISAIALLLAALLALALAGSLTQPIVAMQIAAQRLREHQTIHVPDLLESGSRLADAIQLAEEDFVDYYGTPLIAKGELKGVLEIYHRSALNSDPEWLNFLETLAGQAAIAIDNARLFDALQRSNAELERRVVQRTEELNRTNKELERANRTKAEFLANMSHELRTPLNSILGLSEALLEQRRDPLSEYQQRSLQIVQSSGSHLLELINDILDLSKIEAGKFDYYPQMVSLEDICQSSLSFVKSQAAKKSITVKYIEDRSITKIFADPRRLKQILVNLLNNAVKFTHETGEVILQVSADLEQDTIKFSVIDNGIGISPEDVRRLFQPFMQVSSGLNRQQEGTGLGLALVRRLTDLHGGSVQVESQVDQGSQFMIKIPLGRDALTRLEMPALQTPLPLNSGADLTKLPSEVAARRGVILLAEDNMANILTIGDYLEDHNFELVVAHDGLEAIEKAEQICPNLILMDVQMPTMDGLEATRRLRENPRFKSTPIIALTALAMPGDRERCLAAGANAYMSKPVGLKILLKTIENYLKPGE